MINDIEKLVDYLVEWMKDYTIRNDRKCATINCESPNDQNTLCLAALWKKTNLPIIGMRDDSVACDCRTCKQYEKYITKRCYDFTNLFKLTKDECGLSLTTINKTQYGLVRNYSKHIEGAYDLFPFADLYESELNELSKFLLDENDYFSYIFIDKDLEWADRLNQQTNIISSDNDPTKYENFWQFTGAQKELICRIHAIEKKTRHKENPNRPIPRVRSVPGLVK